jgi:hypothetical protein
MTETYQHPMFGKMRKPTPNTEVYDKEHHRQFKKREKEWIKRGRERSKFKESLSKALSNKK